MAEKTARVGYDEVPVLKTPNVAVPTTTDRFEADVARAISGPGRATSVQAPQAEKRSE